MIDTKFTYLILNLFTIAYPLAQSFEHRIEYAKKWFALFPAMLITAVYFIIWDIIKTYYGVWSFNPKYLVGINIINLPIEEWLFFITVPFACVFIYEVLNYYIKKDYINDKSIVISKILGLSLVFLAVINYDKAYTFVMFMSQGIFLLILAFYIKPKWFGRFYTAYFVSLIPFLVVNGLLTSLPVVIYDNTQNLGVRIYTIPIEDTMYSMMLFLMNITLYERFKKIKKEK
jgi:lycopene cyclase domain-containing protein